MLPGLWFWGPVWGLDKLERGHCRKRQGGQSSNVHTRAWITAQSTVATLDWGVMRSCSATVVVDGLGACANGVVDIGSGRKPGGGNCGVGLSGGSWTGSREQRRRVRPSGRSCDSVPANGDVDVLREPGWARRVKWAKWDVQTENCQRRVSLRAEAQAWAAGG